MCLNCPKPITITKINTYEQVASVVSM